MIIKLIHKQLKNYISKTQYFKTSQKYRLKYNTDYQYFKNIPNNQRLDQILRIKNIKNSNQQFKKQFSKFPNKQIWKYRDANLMTYYWQPKIQNPKAVVIFLNGLNGHTNLWGDTAKLLTSSGIICTGYDYKNFGQSQSKNRGCLQNFQQLIQSSYQFIILIKQKYPNKKIFLIGASLGGLISFQISSKYYSLVNGIIFINPSFQLNPHHMPILKIITYLASFLFPKIKLLKQNGRNSSSYRFDQYIKNDQFLYRGRLHIKTVQQLFKNNIKSNDQYKKFHSPYLYIQGGCDKLVNPFTCFQFQKYTKSPDKTTVIIYNLWHAFWFDKNANEVNKIIEEWLTQKINNKSR